MWRLVSCAAALLACASAGATTVRFDSLDAKTILSDQFEAKGILVEPFAGVTSGIVEENYMGKIVSFSHSAAGDRAPYGGRFTFMRGHKQVRAHVAIRPNADPTDLVLTAFTSDGRIVTSTRQTVNAASGFDNELIVQSSQPNIGAFTLEALRGVNSSPPLVYDLTYDDPPAPDLAVAAATSDHAAPPAVSPARASRATPLDGAPLSAPERPRDVSGPKSSSWPELLLWGLFIALLAAAAYVLWRSTRK
jgi:hypothetical protein